MKRYDATVRLCGDTAHEVNKEGLTAPEIMVLRRIHGLDAVVRIIPAWAVYPHVSHREERDRLGKIYCDRDETAMLLNELFGPDHLPLPDTLDGDEEVVAEQAARDRELKDTNTTTVTQAQLDAMVEKALLERMAEMPDTPDEMPGDGVDPDAPDPATGKAPDHVIAEWEAKREANLAKKRAEG